MIISMIAAMASNRIIGKDNDIPWHLPDDFKYFKDITSGHHVIMGRKNFESLPHKFKPLPNRPNVIVTRNPEFNYPNTTVTHSIEEALETVKKANEHEVFIIGGGEIYQLGLEIAERIYLTEINNVFEGDTHFPEFDKKTWIEDSRIHHPKDERHPYSFDFVIYHKQ